MSTWLINLAGLALMAAVVYWFWLWKPSRSVSADASGVIDITVDNGVYDPAYIEAPAGKPLRLRFHRKDPSHCAEQVIFHGLDVAESLPVGHPRTVHLTPRRPGEYRFTCQMQMYQGKLKITG